MKIKTILGILLILAVVVKSYKNALGSSSDELGPHNGIRMILKIIPNYPLCGELPNNWWEPLE